MRPDRDNMDDLDYLSQQGFEKVPVDSADLDALLKKVKARSFSYNSGTYFGFIGLVAGVFIGLSLFFVWHTEPLPALPSKTAPVISNPVAVATEPVNKFIALDTLTVIKENFIAPRARAAVQRPEQAEAQQAMQGMDSVVSIPEKPIDVALFNKEPLKESRLRFMNNAPVVYIHDMKVSNYTLLYFKNNRFIKWNERGGLSADNASRASQTSSQLKQSPDYFLHEELAKALLYFKKGSYDQCIPLLNTIASYNDKDINCDFYLAMCYYYKRNYAKAMDLFDACITNLNNSFLQEAMYYKACALFDSGNKTEAIPLFKQVADDEGFYAEKAKGYLK